MVSKNESQVSSSNTRLEKEITRSKSDDIRLVKEVYEAFQQQDLERVLGLLTDDVRLHFSGTKDLIPFAGTYQGKDGAGEFFRKMAQFQEVRKLEPREFLQGTSSEVVVLLRIAATEKTHKREFQEDSVHVHTIRDGKISEIKIYSEMSSILQAYGK